MYSIITNSQKKQQSLTKLNAAHDEKVLETLSSIEPSDLKALAAAVEKNPKIIKTALKFI